MDLYERTIKENEQSFYENIVCCTIASYNSMYGINLQKDLFSNHFFGCFFFCIYKHKRQL